MAFAPIGDGNFCRSPLSPPLPSSPQPTRCGCCGNRDRQEVNRPCTHPMIHLRRKRDGKGRKLKQERWKGKKFRSSQRQSEVCLVFL